MTPCQAIILVGGKGTRLGSLTTNIPKPMITIGDKPFLQRLIEEIGRYGFTQVLLLCGHLAEKIYSVYNDQVINGVLIKCVVEKQPMGTGGALLQAKDLIAEEFLLLNGDSLFDFNVLDLQTLARGKNWLGKVALRPVEDTGRYGTVTLDNERITSFAEKKSIGRGLINGGVYLLRRDVLESIKTVPCSLEQDVFPLLAEKGLLYGRPYNGYFIDIGIPEDLQRAQAEIPLHHRPAIFFDRDGVINHDYGYVHSIENFKWIDGAIKTIKLFNDKGWLIIIVTNQSGIARGYYNEDAVKHLHLWMQDTLRSYGAHVDAFYYCPHHPEGSVPKFTTTCCCRKPAPGMILTALQEWPIDVHQSALIGDKESDIEAARQVGLKSILFTNKNLYQTAMKLFDTQ